VIEMAFFSGFTHSEIAGRTGLPLGTIRARIRTGMIQLREQLGFLDGREPSELAVDELQL
jgi:DNA-directed RNA polymerase specialized sigma24 family protein